MLTEAKRVSEIITEKNQRCEEESHTNVLTIRRRALLKVSPISFLNTAGPECFIFPQLHTQLNQALDHSSLPEEELVAYLARLQRDFMKTLKDTL